MAESNSKFVAHQESVRAWQEIFSKKKEPTTPYILNLPEEMLKHIVREATLNPNDWASVSLTCRVLRSIALDAMISSWDVQIPQNDNCDLGPAGLFQRGLLALQRVKELRFVNYPHADRPEVVERDHFLMEKIRARYCDSSKEARPLQPFVRLNQNLRIALMQMKENQLVTFRWECRFPLEAKTLSLVSTMHGKSLRTLRVDGILLTSNDSIWEHPTQISTLIWQPELHIRDPKVNLLFSNRQTLRHLRVGPERALFTRYARVGPEDEETRPWQTSVFNLFKFLVSPDTPYDGKVMYPMLQRLEVVGMDVGSPFENQTMVFPYINFANLKHLALYSCPKAARLLKYLATQNGFDNADQPPTFGMGLKEFVFRSEVTTKELKTHLSHFLRSFSGLETLSVLLDNTEDMIDPACFLARHGKTLQVLVWEGKKEAILDSLEAHTDPYIYLGDPQDPESPMHRILTNCPNLAELSVPIDWTARYRPIWIPNVFTPFNLRTLHIRNSFLKAQRCGHVRESYHRTLPLADELLNNMYNESSPPASKQGPQPLSPTPRPQTLSLLAIGPNNYVDTHCYRHMQCPEDLEMSFVMPQDDGPPPGHLPWQCPDVYAQCELFVVGYYVDPYKYRFVSPSPVAGRMLNWWVKDHPELAVKSLKENYWLT